MENITKKEILSLVNKELLADKLAEKIVNIKTNYDTEIDRALYLGIEKAAKVIVNQLLSEYMFEDSIKSWLKNALTRMSKQELLSILTDSSKNV